LKKHFQTGEQKKLTVTLALVVAVLTASAGIKYLATHDPDNLGFIIGVLAVAFLIEHWDHQNDGTKSHVQQAATAQPTTAQPTTAQPTTAQPTTAQPTTTPAAAPATNQTPARGQQQQGGRR
jgi:hypothetical protein